MTRKPLAACRRRIEALTAASGEFIVICARSGERPTPVAGKRFPDRQHAVAAAGLATVYRTRLRAYDERAPVYDLVAYQESPTQVTRDGRAEPPSVEGGETTV